MANAVNAGAARRALVVLSMQVSAQLADTVTLTPQAAVDLVATAHALAEQALWLRTATVALARRTDPKCRWSELVNVTGITDSTLESRLARWEGRHR